MTEPSDEDEEAVELMEQSAFEQKLSEKRLEEKVQMAEVVGADPRRVKRGEPEEVLVVVYETVSGERIEDWLPMPERYHPAHSDIACLFEFTGANPASLNSLEGARVPFKRDEIRYATMRQVLEQQQAAESDWDMKKRLEKASDLIDNIGGGV
jgi:hypothetical protein